MAEGAIPALTTISNPVVRMARYATDELLAILGFIDKDDFVAPTGEGAPIIEADGRIILSPVLVERTSS